MTPQGEPTAPEPRLRLEAHASENATIFQAARDQRIGELHLYYGDGVHGVRRAETEAVADICPYPGMAPFGPAEAAWFFGRDTVTAHLLERLDEQSRRGGALAVVAPSGAGKSSLLMAGLVPRLANGALPGSRHWPVLAFTPTAHPVKALAGLLASFTGDPFAKVAEAVAAGCESGAALLREALRTRTAPPAAGGVRLLLIVDQLEELLTLCADEAERHEFLDFLSGVTRGGAEGEEPLGAVVYGLRADFYASFADYPQLRSVLQDAQVLVGPMSSDEVRAAILYPAREAGIRVENGLVELLLRDLGLPVADTGARNTNGCQAGRLPLLAHALRAAWQQRHGNTLTVDGYKATGGIHEAVASTAERVYAGLSPAEKEVTPTLFLRLVSIGDGIEDTRRRMSRTGLLAGLDAATASAVLDAFTQRRLLTQEESTVEVTHEALLRAWPRLRTWIDSDKDGHVVRQELERAAAVWTRDGRDPGSLYRGSRLEDARRRTGGPARTLSPAAVAFLDASVRQERLALRRRHRTTAVLSVLSLLATVAAGLAFWQGTLAREQRDTAIGNRLVAEADRLRSTDVSLAAQFDAAAHRVHASPSSDTALLETAAGPLSIPLSGPGGAVESVAFHPGGRILAGAGSMGTVRLWDVKVPTRPVFVRDIGIDAKGPVYSVVFSPDGREMATAGKDGSVRLWDVTDPARPAPSGVIPADGAGAAYAVAFHPDGHTLVSISGTKGGPLALEDRIVRLWDITDPSRPVLLGRPLDAAHGRGASVVTSASGRALLAKGGRLWDLTVPARPREVTGVKLPRAVESVRLALSPDGHTLAVSDMNRSAQLWDLTDIKNPAPLGAPLQGHASAVTALAFDRDGRVLATASSDHTALLWNLTDRSQPSLFSESLTGHTEQVFAVAFSPGGDTLATAGGDGAVRVWTIPNSSFLTGDTVRSLAFSHDGRRLATAGTSVRLWDTTDTSDPVPVGKVLYPSGVSGPPRPDSVGPEARTAAFSPDDRTLAVGGDDGTELWDVTHPARPRLIDGAIDHGAITDSVAFGPDGRTLATAGSGGVTLWDVSDLRRAAPRARPLSWDADEAVFSPDGTVLGTISRKPGGDLTVGLWDVTDPGRPTLLGTPSRPGQEIQSIAFHPGGKLLAGADFDGTVRLWDIEDPRKPVPAGAPLTQHVQSVDSVAFSPDGRILASVGEDGTIRLWDVTDGKAAKPFGSPLTSLGWTTALGFSPRGDVLATNADRIAHLMPMSPDQAVRQICRDTAGRLTADEWRMYVPDLAFTRPCA